MPAHTYDALLRTIQKRDIALVYYLHGSEDVLKDDAVRAIVDCVLEPSLRDFNFDQRSAGQLDPASVSALCNTLPMLAERRVVVLRDLEAWKRKARARAEFLRYLERPAAQTVVVLVQSSTEAAVDAEIAARAYTVDAAALAPERALRWLLREAAALELTLDADAAGHLLQCVGAELGALRGELRKLASLPAGTTLTRELVGELVGIRHGETMFDWRDAVLADEPGRAARLIEPVLAQSGNSGVRLVTLLGTSLIGLGLARAQHDRGLRGRQLEDAVFKSVMKVRPYGIGDWKVEVRRWAAAAPRWPARRIRAALAAALAADQSLKSTTVSDERGILVDLVMTVTIPFREAA